MMRRPLAAPPVGALSATMLALACLVLSVAPATAQVKETPSPEDIEVVERIIKNLPSEVIEDLPPDLVAQLPPEVFEPAASPGPPVPSAGPPGPTPAATSAPTPLTKPAPTTRATPTPTPQATPLATPGTGVPGGAGPDLPSLPFDPVALVTAAGVGPLYLAAAVAFLILLFVAWKAKSPRVQGWSLIAVVVLVVASLGVYFVIARDQAEASSQEIAKRWEAWQDECRESALTLKVSIETVVGIPDWPPEQVFPWLRATLVTVRESPCLRQPDGT